MLMKTLAQHKPLTDAELDRLAEFLKSCKSGKAMNVEQLDGFFAALIAGPASPCFCFQVSTTTFLNRMRYSRFGCSRCRNERKSLSNFSLRTFTALHFLLGQR